MTKQYESLLALCSARHCRRDFRPDHPLSAEQIEQIKTVALTSPYASGKTNWEIMVVTERTQIKAMADAVQQRSAQIEAEVGPAYAENFASYARNFSAFAEAPAVFIPCFRIAPSLSLMCGSENEAIRLWERDNYVKSISCVAMLILLAAESLDLAACYMTGPLLAEEELGRIIGIKRGRNIGALIPVGHKQGE